MIKNASRLGVYGRSGCGKSTRAKMMLKKVRRLVVFDPLDEYAEHGMTRVNSLKQFLTAIRRRWRGGFKVAYVPPAGQEKQALHGLSVVLRQIQEPYKLGADIRQITLLVEELNMSYPVHNLPDSMQGFSELCSRGRHYGINIIGVSQRVAEINTRFRGNTEGAYYFAQSDHSDITTIKKMIGPVHGATLAGLKDHEYLYVSGGKVQKGKNAI
jgi:ABC-type dipeptide/oligopeptide/nickel transport system ATPase component